MHKVQEAVENIRSLGRTFQAIIDFANTLEQVGNFEQAHREGQAALDAIRKDIARATADLQAARDEADEVRTNMQQAKAEFEVEIHNRLFSASQALEAAKAEAARIVQGAKATADEVLLAAQEQAGEASRKLADEQRELADAEAKLARVQAKIQELLRA